jgi:two-component system sensor histidine kinase KdpD
LRAVAGPRRRDLDHNVGVASQRGHLKVFLGMAAGVGKTYRMLQEGFAEWQGGKDMVIGYLETHGRADIERLSEGLPEIPLRQVTYRGMELEEMDLPGILERHPELCLIDELAHSNAPGAEHPKRFEDVEDVLAAGIDVYSTLNVQHLESLNDRITELSGIRVRETLPDGVLARADEVVLIDLSPEALLERLRGGKIYPPERIDMALNNFFRIENLAMLREIALRQVAEEVEVKRLTTEHVSTRGESLSADAPRAVGDRVLALVQPHPSAQRLVRRAWRSAQRLGAELELLWVKSPGEESAEEQRALAALRQLAAVLGTRLYVEESDDLPGSVADVARRHGTTYILMGAPRVPRGLGRLRTPLPLQLMELLPGVDVRMVADRAKRQASDETRIAPADEVIGAVEST